jgi:2-polyprenyl-3-methyl-5-hydroxy-6-metoxy-1,4-benzoquinol methylase
MIFEFFRSRPSRARVLYSCVVDDQPKYYLQGYYFVLTLVKIAKVSGSRIYIHMTAKNPSFERLISEYGVNIVYVQPWGDKKYCNKLAQLDTPALLKADYVFLCDADICIVEDLTTIASLEKVAGKIVDFDNPSLEQLKQIYNQFKIPFPEVSGDTLNAKPTFAGNFNGGLYGVPGKYLKKFGDKWKEYATEILKNQQINALLKEKMIHVDQIAFSLALNVLKLPYQLLPYEMNCPAHLKDFEALGRKLKTSPSVIHYHSNLTTTGLLGDVKLDKVQTVIKQINTVLSQSFNNELFWNYRYSTNPELGSDVGSRGEVAEYKYKLLKMIGIEAQKDVLDVGCGDLEILGKFNIQNYTGVDVSTEALHRAKQKYPDSSFYSYVSQQDSIQAPDMVICLDVALHQPSFDDYHKLINFIAGKAIKNLVVSGYDAPSDKSHMCFFYESLKESLMAQGKFKHVFKIAEYRNLSVYFADAGDLSKLDQAVPNDIANQEIELYLSKYPINQDQLLSAVVASRKAFGWFTKHCPRMIEYPWILDKFSYDMTGLKIVDFGAGITPLPIMFAQRNAKVFTIDNNQTIRQKQDLLKANEWGFFDYAALSGGVISINKTFDESSFDSSSLDVFYSISVIEHMPAMHRRSVLANAAQALKVGGKVFLSIDLCKGLEDLWNMAAGQVVEEPQNHGNLESLLVELKNVGLIVTESQVIRLPDVERVDLALISAVKEQVE